MAHRLEFGGVTLGDDVLAVHGVAERATPPAVVSALWAQQARVQPDSVNAIWRPAFRVYVSRSTVFEFLEAMTDFASLIDAQRRDVRLFDGDTLKKTWPQAVLVQVDYPPPPAAARGSWSDQVTLRFVTDQRPI
jgi:hypothetical protein